MLVTQLRLYHTVLVVLSDLIWRDLTFEWEILEYGVERTGMKIDMEAIDCQAMFTRDRF